jgi:phage terminase large subunit
MKIEILDHFKEVLWEDDKSRFLVLQGGSGSGKSFAICQRLCYLFLTRSNMTIAVVRATMPALQKTVYQGKPSICQQLVDWNINVYSNGWLNQTKNELRNPLNGSVIYFLGLDDPEKIKSMNLNYVFIEEATELNPDKWSQLNFRLRNANPYGINQMFIAYNPISYYNWVVQMFVVAPADIIKKNTHVHFSNFSQNKYIDVENLETLFADAERSEEVYRTYITGIPGMPIGLIYPNIKFAPNNMWDEEVWNVKPYYGIDWGFIDPMVLVECREYKDKIYVRCRYYKTHQITSDLIQFMKDIGVNSSHMVYYDSASPEKGQLLLKDGFTAFPAVKNIDAGIMFLKKYDIIVDTAGEAGEAAMFEVRGYTWERDKQDSNKFINKPIGTNNHFCDAIRYAVFSFHFRDSEFSVGNLDMEYLDKKMKESGIIDMGGCIDNGGIQ